MRPQKPDRLGRKREQLIATRGVRVGCVSCLHHRGFLIGHEVNMGMGATHHNGNNPGRFPLLATRVRDPHLEREAQYWCAANAGAKTTGRLSKEKTHEP